MARPKPLNMVANPFRVLSARSEVHELVNRMVVEGNATMMQNAFTIMTARRAVMRPRWVGNSEV